MRDMTNQQVMDLFDMADINKNGIIDEDEWDAFYTLFISPFENCLITNDYTINSE